MQAVPAWTRHGWPRGCSLVATVCGVFALVGGLASLGAWLFDIPGLADWNNRGLSIQPNTGLAIAFAGAALLALTQGSARWCTRLAMLPALIGTATLFEHLSGIDLGIDTLLTMDRDWGAHGTTAPGRMGLPASLILAAMGVALIVRARGAGGHRLTNALALLALPLSALSMVAYFLGAATLYDLPRYTAIAWQTSVMLSALAAGVLASNWRLAPLSVLMEEGGAGEIARRSLPFVVMVPLALAWIRVETQRAGVFSTEVGTTILVLVLILLCITGVLWGVRAVRRREVDLATLAAQLQEADRRKDEFLATLAHELRNPLAPLANGLDLMTRDASLAATPRQLVTMMQRQVVLLRRMVDDLLDISRITRGHFELRRDTIDLRDVVARAVETVRDLATRNRHDVQVQVPETPLYVFGDGDRLAQVVGNLLHNACKYTPDGGRIELAALRGEREASIVVRDNGVGIPAHLRERVFEMFAQVDTSLERSHGGLGIGLTLVRRIVDKHGGVVSARAPEQGAGSEFVVALPLSRVAQDA
jgi:signal transduction histidine kinase